MLLSTLLFATEVFVDEIVASVNNYAITRSEVIQETRFILVEKKQGWFGRLPHDLLDKVLKRLISKQLIYQELERIEPNRATYEQDASLDRTTLLENFKANFQSEVYYDAFLRSTRLTKESLTALLIKNKRIENFMKRRLELLSRVSNEEINKEVDKRLAASKKDKTKRKELFDFVKQELERNKYNLALENWLESLQNRNRVLQLIEFTKDEPAVSPLGKTDKK